jgi:hypothetical protein
MSPRATIRDWARLIYYLSQNILSLVGVVLTTSSAITLIGFWVYDFMLPGPPHPYVGILLFLILPGVFLLGLLLVPAGIFLRRRKLRAAGELPTVCPAIDLGAPMVHHGLLFIGVATVLNVLIFGFASYKGVTYMDTTTFCGETCHTVMAPEYSAYQNSPQRPRGMRAMPHRPRSRMVRSLQIVRTAPGFRRDLQNVFAPHSFSGEIPAARPRDL